MGGGLQRFFLGLWAGLLLVSPILQATPVHAQDEGGRRGLPAAHLGYGLHLDPNVPIDPAMVSQMGMNWVKLYTESQIPLFVQSKQILFRQDFAPPSNLEAFRAWMQERARVLWAAGVDAIEIHNEPNLSLEWGNRPPNAREYTQALRVAYEAVKAVTPDLIVVSGGLAPTITTPDRMAITDLDYAREMFQAGAGQWFDVFGYHPYGYNAPPEQEPAPERLNFRRTELMWRLMQEFGIRKPMWLTEFGWLRDPAEDGINCSDSTPAFAGFAWLRVDGRTQADYIVRAFAYADRNWPWVGPMFLWNLNFSLRANDGSLDMCSHIRWFGLLDRFGRPTPAFLAVRDMPKRYGTVTNLGGLLPASPLDVPIMALYADEMTLEVAVTCPARYRLGAFQVANIGEGGDFTAQVSVAQQPTGVKAEVSTQRVGAGENVEVFVDTTGLSVGLHLVYINTRTTILGQLRAQYLRGFVFISEDGPCPPTQ